jgi:hypothetical protein
VRYTPGSLDRAANLQSRLELLARTMEHWLDEPVELGAYALGREEWAQARFELPYGLPVRVGQWGVAVPAEGDDASVRLCADLLHGVLPTVQGVPLRGTPQQAAALVVADILAQLLVAEALVDRAEVNGDRPWVRGLLSHVANLGLVARLEPARLRDLDAMYRLILDKREPKRWTARDYGPEHQIGDWLWFQANFHFGAKIIVEKEGKDAIQKMIKLRKKQGRVHGDVLLKRYKSLATWYNESFATVRLQ